MDYHIHETGAHAAKDMTKLPHSFLAALTAENSKLKRESPSQIVRDVFNLKISDKPKCHYHCHDLDHPACE